MIDDTSVITDKRLTVASERREDDMALGALALEIPDTPARAGPTRLSLFLGERARGEGERDLFAGLGADGRRQILSAGSPRTVRTGEAVFTQGDPHRGIYVVLDGVVRVFHTAPSGREITLAYWSPGNFVGGPELFDEGVHLWSGTAVRHAELLGL